MPVYIALLRGINVGGHNKMPMADLRSLLTRSGLKQVASYIQSGNILFASDSGDKQSLQGKIKQAIDGRWGYDTGIFVLQEDELSKAIAENPFLKRGEDESSLYFTFLADMPGEEGIARLKTVKSGRDEFMVSGRILYLFCPDGLGRTKLDSATIESKLKVGSTTRNWKTVNILKGMAAEMKQGL